MRVYPKPLQTGDEIRIIAPSRSLGIIAEDVQNIANQRLTDLGFKVTFGEHVKEMDQFASSSIASRVADLHQAFANPNVKGILTVIGGFNSNQLLRYLDWDLIKNNPKILCGYSDITALNNSILACTGLVTYSGPHYSTFGQKLHFDYTLEYFQKCLMSDEPYDLKPSDQWSDDRWFNNQEQRKLLANPGWAVINPGEAKGTIIGGNLCTLNLLQGTEYFPSLENAVLFIEDDAESLPHTFDRDLQSLIHQPGFAGVKGLIIGRFQNASEMTNDKLSAIVRSKKELGNIPVIAGVDFGHTDPKITFPVGGEVELRVSPENPLIRII